MIQSAKPKSIRNTQQVVPKLSKQIDNAGEQNSLTNRVVPEGYYTLEEFRKIAIEKGHSFCNKHGII
jgi:hypothetical protein